MLHRFSVLLSAGLVVTFLQLDLGFLGAQAPVADAPIHHLKRGFRNVDPDYSYPLLQRALHLVKKGANAPPDRGVAFTVVANDGAELRANGIVPTATWIGHSTFLVQIDGLNVLTDPIWAARVSPVGFAGPRRLVRPGLRFEDLPRIDAVVISHDHYDHLDVPTVQRLWREHRPAFFVPLGVGRFLADVGVPEALELDWWGRGKLGTLTFVCTPAQHSSGRGVHDQNLRLWSSWAIVGATKRFYFAGDTGYYSGLAEIGRRLGPFDLAAIPIGGYSSYRVHHPNHVNPEEAIQLFEDVRAKVMVPMHWGTFELNQESFREPPDRALAEARRRSIEHRVRVLNPGESLYW